MPPEPSYLVGGYCAIENEIDNLDNLDAAADGVDWHNRRAGLHVRKEGALQRGR